LALHKKSLLHKNCHCPGTRPRIRFEMTKRQLLVIGAFGAACYGAYRATRRAEDAAEEYRRRGAQPDVVVAGLVAFVLLAMAFEEVGQAAKKVKRAFPL
jgi:hypothetical protein